MTSCVNARERRNPRTCSSICAARRRLRRTLKTCHRTAWETRPDACNGPSCPTGHIGNTSSEHMGNTFWHLRETRNALEGVIQDGREDAVCGPVDGGREDGGVVPRVRYLAQDRLQAL